MWSWNIFWRAKKFLSSIDIKGTWWCLILYLYRASSRYRSKRSISSLMTTYFDRVRKKILCGSTLSHLLLKLRAIKVDILVSKEPLWTDQIMSVPYASAVRSNMCIQVWTCPCFVIGIIGKYRSKSRNGPVEKPLQPCRYARQ